MQGDTRTIPEIPSSALVGKTECHERFVRAGERRMDAPVPCEGKAKPRVISRVADHDHDTVAETPALAEPFLHKGGADTHALVILVDRERGKGERGGLASVGNDSDRREKDMADNPVAMDCDEREFRR